MSNVEVTKSNTVIGYVKHFMQLATALSVQDYKAMKRALSASSVPTDMRDRMLRFWATGEANSNPLEYKSIETVKVEVEYFRGDEYIAKSLPDTIRMSNRAEQVFRSFIKTVNPDNEDQMYLLAWFIALMLPFGYDQDYFAEMSRTYEDVVLQDGTTRKALVESPVFSSGPADGDATWWQIAQTLPIHLGKV